MIESEEPVRREEREGRSCVWGFVVVVIRVGVEEGMSAEDGGGGARARGGTDGRSYWVWDLVEVAGSDATPRSSRHVCSSAAVQPAQ